MTSSLTHQGTCLTLKIPWLNQSTHFFGELFNSLPYCSVKTKEATQDAVGNKNHT